MINQPTLILMTKSPVAGQVKTRLLPYVCEQTAADIALEMIDHTVEKAVHWWPGVVRLLISPDTEHPAIGELAKSFNLEIAIQSQGNLGEKMAAAICDALELTPAAAVMGCDIPDISPPMLDLAYHRLLEGCNVIGPTADGGFYFAGFSDFSPSLFDDIEWSTQTVFETVLARLKTRHGGTTVILPCLNDIDHWPDFMALANKHPRYAKFLQS